MKPRSLMVVPVVVAAAFAVSAGGASAQTVTAFQATIKSVSPMGNPPPCAHTICGTADVAGYGPATWTFDVSSLTNYGDPTPQCATYDASGAFQLNSDGSTLTYVEHGTVCAPGNSVTAVRKGIFNAPWTVITGSWTVDTSGNNGVFAAVTGSGSDTAKITGPEARGTYTGTSTTS